MNNSQLRWWLCALLFIATGLSFLDRQVLSVLAPVITKQLCLTDPQYSQVTTAFLISYAIMFLVGGRVLDLLGTRIGMTLAVGVWSAASAAHAALRNALQLAGCRFLLGIGEGACFPGAAKGVAEWFPTSQRSLAMGIAIGGASFGAVVAPPLTVWLSGRIGWRGVFLVTGLLGALWVATWWFMASQTKRFNAGATASTSDESPVPLGALLSRADTWGLAIMRLIFDPVFYFYMFWIPKYLAAERSASHELIGSLTWIPFLALGISNALGGWVSDCLVQCGFGVLTARKLIMSSAAAITVASSLTGRVSNVQMAIAMMSLLMFAHGFWITNFVTLIGDRFPKSAVGTVMGFAGAVGACGGILANFKTGTIVAHYGYGPLWLASGLMYPAALVVLLLTVRRNNDRALAGELALTHGTERNSST